METPWLTPPKKAKTVSSAGKVMASFVLDTNSVLMLDYLQKEQTLLSMESGVLPSVLWAVYQ